MKQGGHVWLEKISFPLFLGFDPFPDQYQGCKFLPFSEKFRVKVAKFWTFQQEELGPVSLMPLGESPLLSMLSALLKGPPSAGAQEL